MKKEFQFNLFRKDVHDKGKILNLSKIKLISIK